LWQALDHQSAAWFQILDIRIISIVSERARQGRLLSTTQELVELGSADRLSGKWTRHDRPIALVFFTGFTFMA
jgi:hypothetical protein